MTEWPQKRTRISRKKRFHLTAVLLFLIFKFLSVTLMDFHCVLFIDPAAGGCFSSEFKTNAAGVWVTVQLDHSIRQLYINKTKIITRCCVTSVFNITSSFVLPSPAIMFTSCIVWVTIEDGAHLISHYYFLYTFSNNLHKSARAKKTRSSHSRANTCTRNFAIGKLYANCYTQ